MPKLFFACRLLCCGAMLVSLSGLLEAQNPPPQQPRSAVMTGNVVSATESTIVVRADNGDYQLFVFEESAERWANLQEGARVRVASREDGQGRLIATDVNVISGAAGAPPQSRPPSPDAGGGGSEPVPSEVRELERDIEQQFARFNAGFRAGVGLDPEILTAGVHARVGPFFNDDLYFRPNAEFGFGEVTTLVALNLEAIYRLPIESDDGSWFVYLGAGPGLNFLDQNFEEARQGERDIDFDDFDYDTSLNILMGVEWTSGPFLELKTSAYGRPHIRLLVGYSF